MSTAWVQLNVFALCAPLVHLSSLNGIWLQSDLSVSLSLNSENHWKSWNQWNTCSLTCGGGSQLRSRYCTNSKNSCSGLDEETRSCNNLPCPIHGQFGVWTNWSNCSSSCNAGINSRNRSCDSPEPSYGGKPCKGDFYQERVCFGPCSKNGMWSSWLPWSLCSENCQAGTRDRKRTCDKPKPVNGGTHCPGESLETEQCDGSCFMWTTWISGSCSRTCDYGVSIKTRECMDSNNNIGTTQDCRNGVSTFTTYCKIESCHYWTTWSNWTPCTNVCDSGSKERSRECEDFNGAPADLNKCGSNFTETTSCNTHPCYYWSPWAAFGDCSVTCDDGLKLRSRNCHYFEENLAQDFTQCPGVINEDEEACRDANCQVPEWGDWSRYHCPSGHTGKKKRFRSCLDSANNWVQIDNNLCPGSSSESHPSITQICLIGIG